jgi:hypothetical protein
MCEDTDLLCTDTHPKKKLKKTERKFRQTCFALTHTGWNKVREYGVTSGRVLGPLSHLQRYTQKKNEVREDTDTEQHNTQSRHDVCVCCS